MESLMRLDLPSSRSDETSELRAPAVTQLQLVCLAWVERGKSSSDIGGILGISHKTVDKHILKVCAALGVKSRFQAAQKARQLGLFSYLEGIKITPRSWVALPLCETGNLPQS